LPKVEAYYSKFIRNRSVESRELPKDDRTQVELTAEDHLRSNEAMLEESYYTGPIRKALGIETESELEKKLSELSHKSFNWEPSSWIWRDNLITKVDLGIALSTFNRKLDDVDLKKVLERARYAPSALLFNERKRGAEKGLVEQIKQSLIKRGFKGNEFEIKLNEKGEYEVKKKEKEESKKREGLPSETSTKEGKMEKGKENLREIDSVEGSKNKVRIVGGKVVKIIDLGENHGTTKGQGYIEFPDKSTKLINGIHNFLTNAKFGETKNGLWFKYVNFDEPSHPTTVLNYNGKEYRNLPGGYEVMLGGDNCGETEDGKFYFTAGKNIPGSSRELAVFYDGEPKRFFEAENLEIYNHGKAIHVVNDARDNKDHIYIPDKNLDLGPYDDIKLCENSKDKLVFYARKGDEHFVYVDGVEKPIRKVDSSNNTLERVDSIVVNKDNEIYLECVLQDGYHAKYNFSWMETDSVNFFMEAELGMRNFSEVEGELFYFFKRGDDSYMHWGFGQIPIDLKSTNNNIEGLRNNIFISDDKRVLISEYVEDKSKAEIKELTFDGDVELVNSAGKLFIIESLADKKRVWEYDEKGELKLNEREQRDLDLANAVAKEDLEEIKKYFNKYYPKEQDQSTTEKIKSELKGMLEQSKSLVNAVNRTIKEAPELFMDTFRAKDDKPTEFLMTQMFYYMFPEAQAKREQALKEEKRKSWLGGFGGSGRSERDSTFNYDQGVNALASVDESGYYEMVKANREVLKLREPLPTSTFITQGIFGKHNESGWTRVNVPLNQEIQDPAKETTFEFVDEKASQTINLPRIAGSKIITERLKGITSKGKEVPVKILEENNQGEVRVDKGKEAKRLTYSQSFSEVPKTMAEVTQKDYEKFKKDFERSFGDVMTEPIGDLGDELDIFVRGLKDKSPREQVIAIQEFCYEYGYYNLDKEPRDTNSFEERLSIMEGRMDELKEKDPKLAHKLYAGICTDFATLTTALLRKAGFVSGISTGFVPEPGSTSIKTDRAHAVSYVLWPSSATSSAKATEVRKATEGKPDMIIVDGTPSNITPKIIEQEKKAAEIHRELGVDAEKELAKLEDILKTMDAESIKKLENGVLEKTLNNILYGVKQSHVDVMERILNASRYAGFDLLEMKRGNLEDQIEFRKFLEEEIYKEKSAAHENRERRGEELFNMMLEFTRRFEKDKNIRGKGEALDVLEKVFDVAGKYLDPIEDRSAAAITTYLRARKMR
jgi:hypothetical protein